MIGLDVKGLIEIYVVVLSNVTDYGLFILSADNYAGSGKGSLGWIFLAIEAEEVRNIIWDMINTLVLDTVAVEPTFVAFL